MADPESTTPRPVQSAEGTLLSEFRDLVNRRDYFAYHAEACAETALAELENGDIEGAKRILASAVSLYQAADRAINKFRKEHPHVHTAA